MIHQNKHRLSVSISKCGTLLAVLVLGIALKHNNVAFAEKELEEPSSLLLQKPDGGFIGESEDSMNVDDDKWRMPCFYPNSFESMVHYYDFLNSEYPQGTVKRTFNSWGGKRSRMSDYFRRMSEMSKKGSFNPFSSAMWGGKRDTKPSASSRSKNDYSANRVPFNAWGGR